MKYLDRPSGKESISGRLIRSHPAMQLDNNPMNYQEAF